MNDRKKKGLSGLYILLVLFAVMILFGGPAIVRMINIILFGQCNVAPEANKMKGAIEEVCRGAIGDSKQVDYPSCPVFMKCDNCATAAGKAVFRSVLGAAQVVQFGKNLKATWNAGKNMANYVKNAKTFLSDFRYGLSETGWTRLSNWKEAYQYAKWDAGPIRAGYRGIDDLRTQASALTPVWTATDYTTWQRIGNAGKTLLSTAQAQLTGYSASTGPMQLARRAPATAKYYFIAADPYGLRPDIQAKVAALTNDVVENAESILCDPTGGGECKSQGTVIVPIGLDVYLITKKEADTNGDLARLATESGSAAGEANELLFELNTKLISLFTSVNDQVYANAAFGQGSCTQPSSSGFNSIPSSYSEVQGACTLTSTVVALDGEDCGDQTDANFSKCTTPDSVAEQDEAVDRSAELFLRRNHAFRFIDDLRGFLLNRADGVAKKSPANKAEIMEVKANITSTLKNASEVAGKTDDAWFFTYVAMGAVADDVATMSKYEQQSGVGVENSLISWYKGAFDSMSSIRELISGLEEKHKELLKSRNKAFDILNELPSESCEKKSDVVSPDGMTVTVPMCSLISSCNQDDRVVSQTSGCLIAAANLEKGRVKVGDVYFSMPAIPVAPIDYGTTINDLQVPIGLISGLVGGEAGKALATAEFSRRACKGSPSEKTLIFCMKPASPVCALPGGCEVCFAAKCNTPIICSSVGAANLRIEKKSEGLETITELTGPVKPI